TYHRTHPDAPAFARNERDGLADGDPVDNPAYHFVIVSVEMPLETNWKHKQTEAVTYKQLTQPTTPIGCRLRLSPDH
ncbi:phage tail fiber protein, partial [Enterobacter intestinihominis]